MSLPAPSGLLSAVALPDSTDELEALFVLTILANPALGYAALFGELGGKRAEARVAQALRVLTRSERVPAHLQPRAAAFTQDAQATARRLLDAWVDDALDVASFERQARGLLRKLEGLETEADRRAHAAHQEREGERTRQSEVALRAIGLDVLLWMNARRRLEGDPQVDAELMAGLHAYLAAHAERAARLSERANALVEQHLPDLRLADVEWLKGSDPAAANLAALALMALWSAALRELPPSA